MLDLLAQLNPAESVPTLLAGSLVETMIPVFGFALCALAILQAGLWAAQSYLQTAHNEKQFELSQKLLRRQIDAALTGKTVEKVVPTNDTGDWNGFRKFRIDHMVRETALCTSMYLKPEDGKPMVGFKPGQHLTFKFQIPGESKPVVRCYSLSDSPDKGYYRVSVKAMPAPHDKPELPPGKASNFVNKGLMIGDVLEVKSPSGHFFLDDSSDAPIVMLAGGIGITPMMSMLEHLVANDIKRLVVLVYGSRNSEDHAFKARMRQLADKHQHIHIVDVYSSPLPKDQLGTDYHQHGFVTIDLLKRLLPNNKCQFYMCGPPPFMSSVYDGLIDWNVPESRILFEAFGPASIGKGKKAKTAEEKAADNGVVVSFAKSGKQASWNADVDSILELAEENDVVIDSGCRAGSCGTCETAIAKGKVKYPEGEKPECTPGHCLACIARPDGPVELDV